MNVSLWPVKKSIRLYLVPVAFLLIPALSCFSQPIHSKPWKAVVFTGHQKVKGILFQVSDSSLVLTLRNKSYDEILFSNIHKIRLRRPTGAGEIVVGFLAGAAAGATIGGGAASRGREGEPGALAGIYGGIAGFLVGGWIGIGVAVPVYQLISTRTYIVPRDPLSYPSFAAKLRRRSLRR